MENAFKSLINVLQPWNNLNLQLTHEHVTWEVLSSRDSWL